MKYMGFATKLLGIVLIVIVCNQGINLSFLSFSEDAPVALSKKYATLAENKFYDLRAQVLRESQESAPNDNVVLVAIDDASLQKINSWPIPRDNWAILLNKLKSFGAKVAAFDVFFPEPALACFPEDDASNPDNIFAQAIQDFQADGQSHVILSFTTEADPAIETFRSVPLDIQFNGMANARRAPGSSTPFITYIDRFSYPIEKILEAQPGLGAINMGVDPDGVFRHYKVTSTLEDIFEEENEQGELQEERYLINAASLGLKAFNAAYGNDLLLDFDASGIGKINLSAQDQSAHKSLVLNELGETKIRWLGNLDKFSHVPLHRVIFAENDDQELRELFADKIVFIGSTAQGAHDLRNTPVSPKTPGVLAHMNFVHMLSHHYVFAPLEDSYNASKLFFFAALALLLGVMYFKKALLDAFALASILVAVFVLDYQFFLPSGYELKLFFTSAALVSCYSWITVLNFNKASSEKRQIKGAFSRYVAPAIVNDMLSHPEKLKVGGEKRDITCLFSDVRDFTTISEQLSPSELGWALNRYMGKMTDIVFATNGTLDKYIGDAIVAFWGAPLDIGDHVTQAVQAAVAMLEALPEVNKELAAKNLPEFKIGLGLNSGECSVGNMGSDQIFAYTALGDAMNLGARLESLCKHYGAQILISEFTYQRMDQNLFVCRQIDRVRVKGKTEPVGVYEVLYSYHPLFQRRELLQVFNESYELFIKKSFAEARQGFERVLEELPEESSSLRMLQVCQNWLDHPPAADEDHTVTTMEHK